MIFILVTCRVKGYIVCREKYVTGRSKRLRPQKVYIFLIRITSRVDLVMPVCLCERCDLGNYKTYTVQISNLDSLSLYAAKVC